MKIKLNNVRLSFPSLFKKAQFQGQETKFEATFLISKESQDDLIEKINIEIDNLLKAKFPNGKVPKSIKKTCFKDGDECDYDGYEGMMALKGSSNRRVTLIDRNKTPLAEEDGKLYAGCYVNAILEVWFSDHPLGGKQVLANLLGVQFAKEGESFGSAPSDVTDDFDELEDEF